MMTILIHSIHFPRVAQIVLLHKFLEHLADGSIHGFLIQPTGRVAILTTDGTTVLDPDPAGRYSLGPLAHPSITVRDSA